METSLLSSLRCNNQGSLPIWMMRQAGRYLPEYRSLRARYPLKELFFTPELAVQITCQPIERFGFDAAILFSDITVVAEAMGKTLSFQEGPSIFPRFSPEDKKEMQMDKLFPIFETISLLKKRLFVPLIGFCGAPFTVASYLLGGMETLFEWQKKGDLEPFLDHLQEVTLLYVQQQVERGVDVIQVFDSWANLLSFEEFRKYTLSFLEKLLSLVSCPVIFFMRDAARYASLIPCAISIDENASFQEVRKKTAHPIQGNLSPDLLLAPLDEIEEKVSALLQEVGNDRGFIVNLGHGIKPNTPIAAVQKVVDLVRKYER